MMNLKGVLTIDGKELELPIVIGTEGEKGIDIADLLAKTGCVTLDSGYKNTGATLSKITFMDGDKGILRHRGYPIEELAEHASFLEVAYLLIHGELPSKKEQNDFEKQVLAQRTLSLDIQKIIENFPKNTHPMAVLSAAVLGMSATQKQNNFEHMVFLLAQLPSIAAAIYRVQNQLPILAPKAELSYSANFLYMLSGQIPSQLVAEALDRLFILHADHEQNCSTSTVRMVGSAQAGLYASVSAGINALWGPLHGGANQAVIEMLEQIKTEGGAIEKWIARAKDKNDTFRLMGFGHRVYKNFDPRAKIIKKAADTIFTTLKIQDPVLEIAKSLEEAALADDYFKERKLYPNVDFYSGIIYRALGISVEMFTVLFALGRLPGWMSQWQELLERKEPIGRPRQLYTGSAQRKYILIDQRDKK